MHANARLTPIGRLTMVMRIESGRPVAHVAAEMGISRPTAYKWWHRWDELGVAGLVDRSSRPRSCPHQTSPPSNRRSRSCGAHSSSARPASATAGGAAFDGAPGADPFGDQPAVVDGPPHRSGDPSL